jgi:hypothetical protein
MAFIIRNAAGRFLTVAVLRHRGCSIMRVLINSAEYPLAS